MIEIARIEKAVRNPRFVQRVFSIQEQQFFATKNNSISSMAANFAAKEAFSKALGTGVRGFSLNEISVLRDELGAPCFAFDGNALALVEKRCLTLSLSLTHTKTTAAAFVVAYSY